MVAFVVTFCASSAPVPPVVPAFFPTEKTTNGAFVVRLDGVQPRPALVTVVVTTVSKLTAGSVSAKQPMVAVFTPSVLVRG